jgi:hypothetical protein
MEIMKNKKYLLYYTYFVTFGPTCILHTQNFVILKFLWQNQE